MPKRIVIFAHFDRDNIVDDYVIEYLNLIQEFAEDIIFVSDNDLSNKEVLKVSEITSHIIAKHHGMYDWGSYKIGYLYAKENLCLQNYDEMILCNDSVFPIVENLQLYINCLTNQEADFGGFYKNIFNCNKKPNNDHIQSWFIHMKKQVFSSDIFDMFITKVKKESSKVEIINKYEIGFTKLLGKYFSYDYLYSSNDCDAVYSNPIYLCQKGFPFIKITVLKKSSIIWYLYLKNKNSYNLALNLKKRNTCNNKLKTLQSLLYWNFIIIFNFLYFSNREIYKHCGSILDVRIDL